MRIGFDAKRAFHNTTGLGNYSRDIIRLFTHNRPNDEFFLFDPQGKGIHFDYNLFNSHIINSNRKTGIGKDLWRRYGLAREVNNLHVNVYHGLSNELPVGIEKSGVKSIVTVHDLIFERHPEWYTNIDRSLHRMKVKKAVEVADVVVAISNQTKEDLLALYNANPEKIVVVYQGCNPAFAGNLNAEQLHTLLHSFNLPERFALYVGTIEPRKNLHRLVLALREENIPLVVVGRETDYVQKVKEALKASWLEKNFYYLTNLNLQHLAALYQAARVFIYPSLYEGFGIPVIEALHCGTPVITGLGSMAEACGGGGLAIDVTQPDLIKQAVLQLWNDDSLHRQMADAGKMHVQQFSDANQWQRWNEVYARL